MARTFVTRDDERVRVELVVNPETGANVAVCEECAGNLLEDTHAQWNTEDSLNAAEIHIIVVHEPERID
jgi:hypothetical protein